MAPFQQRVVDEKYQLDGKRAALEQFIRGAVFPSLPADEQDRMNRQYAAMTEYSNILAERIAAF